MDSKSRITQAFNEVDIESKKKHIHRVLIETDQPDYLPSSGRDSTEIKEMISDVKSDISILSKALMSDQLSDQRTRIYDDVAVRFGKLTEQWRKETVHASSVLETCMNPSYQRIIGLGRSAIPLILRELHATPDHWFWALKAITGEDPVRREDRGNLHSMTEAWLAWGARNGYDA